MEKQQLSAVASIAREHGVGWGAFIFGVFRVKSLTKEERVEKAKARWLQCRKLRPLLSSLAVMKDEQESKLLQPYYGFVREDLEEQEEKRKPFLIYPETQVKTLLDSAAAGLVTYFAFVVSYRVGFYTDEENAQVRWFDAVCDLALLLYGVLNFFMAYIEDKEVVDDRWLIACRYFRTLFLPDVIAFLPLHVLNPNLLFLKLLRLLRINLVSLLLENFVDFLSKTLGNLIITWQVKLALNRLLQFFLYLSIICHLIACGWHFLAIKEGVPLAETWLQGVEMTNTEAYIVSAYWVMVTFTTVGYGDITPKTDIEIMYAMVVEFIGILFFAYLVGSMNAIASNMNKWEIAKNKKETDLEKWLMMLDRNRPDKRLKPELHSSIKNYFLYIWKYDHSMLVASSEFFMRLPTELRKELAGVLFSDILEKFHAFVYQCEEDFAFALVLSMYPRKFKKFEIVLSQGAVPSELYFIDEGLVQITLLHGAVTCLQLQKGSFVGDFELIFGSKLEASYRAGPEGCEMYCVKASVFESLLLQHRESLQRIASRSYSRFRYFQAVITSHNSEEMATDISRIETDFLSAGEETKAEAYVALRRSFTLRHSNSAEESDDDQQKEQRDATISAIEQCQRELSRERAKHDSLMCALRNYGDSVESGRRYREMYAEIRELISNYVYVDTEGRVVVARGDGKVDVVQVVIALARPGSSPLLLCAKRSISLLQSLKCT